MIAALTVSASHIEKWDPEDPFCQYLPEMSVQHHLNSIYWTRDAFLKHCIKKNKVSISSGYVDCGVTLSDTSRGCFVNYNKSFDVTVTNTVLKSPGSTILFDYTASIDLVPDENGATTYHAVFVIFFATVSDPSTCKYFSTGVDGFEFVKYVPAGTVGGEEQMESGTISYKLPDNFDPSVHLVGYSIWKIEDKPIDFNDTI